MRLQMRRRTRDEMQFMSREPSGKKWKRAVDESLRGATSVEQVLSETLHVLRPDILDAPPSSEPRTEDLQQETMPALPKRGEGAQARERSPDLSGQNVATKM
ncbi:hypothetical protein CYMTET_10392 [Cymbomonas tetramitiformis]|uniref:Uncharacterized protein n=1 Tax=Cymbomonas tetramitiformis TaxID=36881 RepID=A0AAE0GPF3_9CHLO|nr:hypothetical protein CYMTET_10392 [Cymbomonas tetramitiformis]